VFVARIELTDFRNYAHAVVELGPGVTVILGPNGQGKTNLVEAIGYLASGSSHRVSNDHALVRFGEESATVRATLRHGEREVLMECQINRSGANRLLVNRSIVRSREAQRYIDSVLFAPEDLSIVRGEPSGRRRVLDALIVAITPRMSAVMSDYERVVRQRTTLLKSARATRVPADALGTLDIWDDRLAQLGAEIMIARERLIAQLLPRMDAAYQRIAGTDQRVALAMTTTVDGIDTEDSDPSTRSADPERPSTRFARSGTEAAPVVERAQRVETHQTIDDVRTRLLARIAEVRRAELDRAVTLVGPHRDDLVIELNGLPARGYASHGESWSLALALRLASAELLRDTGAAGDPVVILDDVFAELDEGRRARLLDAVLGFEQVIVTAAVGSDVPQLQDARVVRIRGGEVVDV
jgi:DNA replication and repair protein RecF